MQAFLLGISGRMGAGKTTLAGMLTMDFWHSYGMHTCTVNFADGVKQEAILKYGLSFQEAYGTCKRRDILQAIGHNYRHFYGQDYWIRQTFTSIAWYAASANQCIIIADVRYPNEVDAIHNHGGYIIRLTRNPVQSTHPSETALDTWQQFDAILNNGTLSLEETHTQALAVIVPWINSSHACGNLTNGTATLPPH